MLNLPKFLTKTDTEVILIVGCGGGWDVIGGLPIADSLPTYPKVIFANYSSHKDEFIKHKTEKLLQPLGDCHPESFISSCIDDTLYVIGRHGVKYVRKAIQEIIDEHNVDLLLIVDGGVDALMHGDEIGSGTILEDFIMLSAVNGIQNVDKYFVSLGLGTETEEEVNHYCVLENISKLMQMDGYLGSCALTKDMDCFIKYKEVQKIAIKLGAKPSHVHTKVIAAVEGLFGKQNLDYDTRLSHVTDHVFINPLMSLYWFFTFESVAANNLFITLLENTNTFIDAKIVLRQNIDLMNKRPRNSIPL